MKSGTIQTADHGDICESCGPMEYGDPIVYDELTWWCVNCAVTNGLITDQQAEAAQKKAPIIIKSIEVISTASGDWEGLYINGELKAQGHSIPIYDLARFCNIPYTSIEIKDKWAESNSLPEQFSKLPKKAKTRS